MARIIVSFSGGSRVTFVEDNEGEIYLAHDEADLVPGGEMPLEARIIITATRRIYLDLNPDALSIKYDSSGFMEIRIADKNDIPLFEVLFKMDEVDSLEDLLLWGDGSIKYLSRNFAEKDIRIIIKALEVFK